jgi:hypothetical protein
MPSRPIGVKSVSAWIQQHVSKRVVVHPLRNGSGGDIHNQPRAAILVGNDADRCAIPDHVRRHV